MSLAGSSQQGVPAILRQVVRHFPATLTTAAGTAERVLASGSTWWSDGVAWHEAVNIGETTAVYVIVEPKDRDPG